MIPHLLLIVMLGGGGQVGLPWTERDQAIHDCYETSPNDDPDTVIAGCIKLVGFGWNLDSKRYADVLVNIGVARWQKKDFKKAEEDFEAAVKMNRRQIPAHLDRAAIRIVLGRAQDAFDDLEYVLEKEPAHPSALNIRCFARGMLNRELEQALVDCDQSLKIREGHPETLSSRALVLYRQNKFQQALADIENALKTQPNDASKLLLKGLIKKKLGDSTGDADIATARLKDVDAVAEYRQYGIGED